MQDSNTSGLALTPSRRRKLSMLPNVDLLSDSEILELQRENAKQTALCMEAARNARHRIEAKLRMQAVASQEQSETKDPPSAV